MESKTKMGKEKTKRPTRFYSSYVSYVLIFYYWTFLGLKKNNELHREKYLLH